MPIEFQCSSCQRKLRVSDESAGRDARCPQCKAVQRVPHASTSAQGEIPIGPPGSGPGASSTPQPTGGDTPKGPSADLFAGFSAKTPSNPNPAPSGPPNPYASNKPNPYATPSHSAVGTSKPQMAGSALPSFDEEQSPATFFKSIVEILTDPSDTFKRMKKSNGFGAPLVYSIIGGVISVVVSFMFTMVFSLGAAAIGGENPVPVVLSNLLQFGLQLVFVVIGCVIGMFVSGGIYHVILMMMSGDNHPYETTCRTVAYVSGTFSVIAAIPIIGPTIGGIVAIVYMILALAETQECGGGKAAAAVLIPIAVCCIAVFGIIAVMVAIGVAVANN